MMLRNVQALRAIAALLVVCVHMGNSEGFEVRYLHVTRPLLAGLTNVGYTGVDLFFVISGFIMTVTTLGRVKPPSSVDFFIRRVIRIYPPLWIITGFLFVLYLWRPELINSHSAYPPDIMASFLALPQRGSPLLLVGWSLAYEMYFYLIFTAALTFGRRSFVPVVIGWALLTIACNVAFGSSANPWLHTISNPICFEFLLGVAVGGLINAGYDRASIPWLIVGAVSYAIAATLGFGEGWWRVLAAVPFAIIIYAAVAIERRHALVLPALLDRLGDSSYATYLWHVPILAVYGLAVSRFHPRDPSLAVDAAVVVGGVMLVEGIAFAIYTSIDRPLTERLRDVMFTRRRAVKAVEQRT